MDGMQRQDLTLSTQAHRLESFDYLQAHRLTSSQAQTCTATLDPNSAEKVLEKQYNHH